MGVDDYPDGQPLLDDIERPIGEGIDPQARRRRPSLDREDVQAIIGGATRGSYRKLAFGAVILATVGVAFALLVTAVELSREPGGDNPADHMRVRRDSADYHAFLGSAGELLPATLHAELPAAKLGAGRLLVVGDVHGCLTELRELLEAAQYEHGTDTVVLVGDLVEKGPYPLEVLAEARRLGFLSVRGNHDDAVLAAWEAHTQRGKRLPKRRAWLKQLPAGAARWLHGLPFSLRVPSHGLIIVHAGVVPDVPLERQRLADLYLMREVRNTSDGRWMAEEAKCDKGKLGPPWASVWPGPEHILFGHDHQRGLQERDFATGIDTGCCYGERLTAAVFPPVDRLAAPREGSPGAGRTPSFKLVSVPAHKQYWDDDPCP